MDILQTDLPYFDPTRYLLQCDGVKHQLAVGPGSLACSSCWQIDPIRMLAWSVDQEWGIARMRWVFIALKPGQDCTRTRSTFERTKNDKLNFFWMGWSSRGLFMNELGLYYRHYLAKVTHSTRTATCFKIFCLVWWGIKLLCISFPHVEYQRNKRLKLHSCQLFIPKIHQKTWTEYQHIWHLYLVIKVIH